jgi:3-phenylpropionate/trans-cinnamate dioxygenase ferredoxin subunit
MSDEDVVIVPHNDGPYEIRGRVTVRSEGGRALEPPGSDPRAGVSIRLCRCGQSSQKPFCDDTHARVGFRSNLEGRAASAGQTGELVDVLPEPALQDGEMKGVDVDGERVLVARVGGVLRAIGGICTHQTAYLEDGVLEGDMVRCPRHGAGFSLKTGEALHLPAEYPVPVYDVKVEGGRILVARRPR